MKAGPPVSGQVEREARAGGGGGVTAHVYGVSSSVPFSPHDSLGRWGSPPAGTETR